jgi:hypothetical protein
MQKLSLILSLLSFVMFSGFGFSKLARADDKTEKKTETSTTVDGNEKKTTTETKNADGTTKEVNNETTTKKKDN